MPEMKSKIKIVAPSNDYVNMLESQKGSGPLVTNNNKNIMSSLLSARKRACDSIGSDEQSLTGRFGDSFMKTSKYNTKNSDSPNKPSPREAAAKKKPESPLRIKQ